MDTESPKENSVLAFGLPISNNNESPISLLIPNPRMTSDSKNAITLTHISNVIQYLITTFPSNQIDFWQIF